MRLSFILPRFVLLGLALFLHGQPSAQEKTVSPVVPVEIGAKFPPTALKNLNPEAGPAEINLTAGQKPIVLFYWIPANPRADEVLLELQALVAELGETRPELYAIVYRQPGRGPEEIKQHIKALGVEVPVLDDPGFTIGQQLRVQSVPNITLLDRTGALRLTNGASLRQVLEYEMDLERAIRRMANTGKVGTYGYLAPYYPATELVGRKCPDFTAPLITSNAEQSWSSLLDEHKVNVLIFWAVDCPHCRRSLPEINAWLKQHRGGLNVISAARVNSEEIKNKTLAFCEAHEFTFRTLVDENQQISSLFRVTTTPTIVIIKPDGVIDSVLTTGTESLQRMLEEKTSRLLDPQRAG